MKPESMDAVFQALAHAGRRRILDIVKQYPGCNVNQVCDHFDMSRIGVMKHLKLLEAAKLILSQKKGRSRKLFFNAVPIQLIHDRWTTEYSAFWASQVTDLKFAVELQQSQSSTAAVAAANSNRPESNQTTDDGPPATTEGRKKKTPTASARKSTAKQPGTKQQGTKQPGTKQQGTRRATKKTASQQKAPSSKTAAKRKPATGKKSPATAGRRSKRSTVRKPNKDG